MNNRQQRNPHRMGRVLSATLLLPILLLSGLAQTGCDEITGIVDGRGGADSYVFWITATQDSYISCGRTASCEEGDLNFGRHGFLVVAEGPLGHKRSYLDFRLPDFPEGTVIDEAHIELYHPSQREDGSTDDISMFIAPLIGTGWSENSLTWNDRPDPGSSVPTGAINLALKSFDWSSTTDMSSTIQQAVDATSDLRGFMINIGPQFGSHVEKGFYSTNYTNRSRDDFDRAPRLMLKVTLPAGSPYPSTILPPGLADNNATISYQFRSGTAYPEDWDVSGS